MTRRPRPVKAVASAVTDEMVIAFYMKYQRNGWPVFESVKRRIKAGLKAAITPIRQRKK